VPHLGNSNGPSGELDALDDRLFAAVIRNGHLWTAHNIQVNSSGVASSSGGRDGSRWYDLTNLDTTPTVVQSGTVYDSSASNPLFYWIPSIMVSGQGHVAMGFSVSGAAHRVDAGTVGRLASDPLGTMETPVLYTSSSSSYNPGSTRWGDYSYTSVDPDDDMTMWTIQEYVNATNSWGVQVAKLLAPPPATPASTSTSVVQGVSNIDVIVTGSVVTGSGFFDPGAGFVQRIGASISGTGVTVNSVTYTDPTHVTLNLTVSLGAATGPRDVTIINPDGQSTVGTGILTITPAPADLQVSKTESIDPVIAGSGPDNLVYVGTVKNNGPGDATNVKVSEALTLPDGVSVGTITPSTGSYDGGTNVWTIPILVSGASATLTVNLTVAASAAAGTNVISDTATVTAADQSLINTGDDTATETTSVARTADLVVSKTGPVTVVAGANGGVDNLSYTITVNNNGPSDASGVALTDTMTLPPGVTVSASTSTTQGSFDSGTGVWTVGDIASGASATLTLVLNVAASAANGALVQDTAAITAAVETDPDTSNNTSSLSTTVSRQVDLKLTKSDGGISARRGQIIVYTLTYSNLGPSDASGVVITQKVPANTTFNLASSTPGWFVTPDGNAGSTCTFSVGTLAAGSGNLTVNFAVRVNTVLPPRTHLIGNQARIDSSQPDLTPGDNIASDTTLVNSKPVIRLLGRGARAVDADSDRLRAIVTGPRVGTLLLGAHGTFTFVPRPGFQGHALQPDPHGRGRLRQRGHRLYRHDPLHEHEQHGDAAGQLHFHGGR
jgi:uncharacterized repeat protein (TIGR01451 family)